MAQKLNIANFICKIGENIVLLDMFDDVILPAFKANMERTYGDDIRYFFHDVKLIDLSDNDSPELAIAGRFVKQSKLEREQFFSNGELVKDPRKLETAPTSFFALLLSNHKLLYVRENSGAPPISTFEATINAFVKKRYRAWLDEEVNRRKKSEKPVTKKSLTEEVPSPNIEIVELSTNSEIHSFVKKFRVINTVEIKPLSTNHETDNSPLFRNLRRVQDRLGSDQLTIKNSKSGDVGLNKSDVADFVAGQAEEANARIIIKGVDVEGEQLDAANDHFKLSIAIREIPAGVVAATRRLFEIYLRQTRSGNLEVKRGSARALRAVSIIRGRRGLW